MLTVILLPGLDGTPNLYEPLLPWFPPELDIRIVTFPKDRITTFEEIVRLARKEIESAPPCVLLSWSYSGHVAHALQQLISDKIRAHIFVATFAETPHPVLLRLVGALPLGLMFKIPSPRWLVRLIAFGSRLPMCLIDRFRSTFYEVDSHVIADRFRSMIKLNTTQLLRDIHVPSLYLCGSLDVLVPRRHLRTYERAVPQLHVAKIPGSHFMLQTNPRASAEVIVKFVHEVSTHDTP